MTDRSFSRVSVAFAAALLMMALHPGVVIGQELTTTAQAAEAVRQVEPILPERGATLSLDLNNASLEEAIRALAEHTDYRFSYSSESLPAGRRVTLSLHGVTPAEALHRLINEAGMTYEVSESGHVIPKEQPERHHVEVQAAAAAQHMVTGVVTSADDDRVLPGVNITVKGTTIGTSTDLEGQYTLEAPSPTDTLVFSFVGFLTQEVPIDHREEIDVAMEQDIAGLEEVIVVGYGTQRRETLTGSVSAISGDQLEKAPVTNISNTLSGQVPGVVSVNPSGEPGADAATVNIRGLHTLGDNSPLIVIDGVPNRAGGMNRLNPRDIENISVLKDASAAIYGSQAANGVILITTKRGQTGEPQFSVNVNHGFNQPTRIPEMADAATYLTMLNEIDVYRGRTPTYSEERIENHRNVTDPWLYPDTDWFDETLKSMSQQTRADMSVSGGAESVRYYVSLGALTEDGFYKNSATRYNQFDFRSNIDADVTDNISLDFDITGRWEDRNYPTRSQGEIFRMVMRGKPHLPAYWPSGEPGPDIEYGDNPVVASTPETGYNDDNRYYFQGNVRAEIEIPAIDGLSIRGNAAYDKSFRHQKVWQTPWTLYNWDGETVDDNGDPVLVGSERGYSEPRLSQEAGEGQDILLNLVLNYEQNLDDHYFGFLVGAERQMFSSSNMEGFRRFFATDQIDQLFAGGEDEREVSGSASHGARMNYFTRLNYDYNSRYLFEFVGRYDGSYIFPEERRFGFFPGFSVGWRLGEEQWFSNAIGFFDELKLRASWGQTGNDRIDPYQYLATFGFGDGYVLGGSTIVNSVYQTRIPNRNVGWEVANQFDVGVEMNVLDNRLLFEFDYFNYLRTEILWWRNASVPMTTGFSLPRENIGRVASHGVDGSLTYQEQWTDDFQSEIGVNIGYAENEIEFWDEAPGAPEWQQSTGRPMGASLYYNVIGVFQSEDDIESYPSWPGARPGDLIFEDVNEDGTIDGRDMIRIDKTGTPKWTGGVTFSAGYKQFDFTAFFQGAAGAVQYIKTESGEIGNFLKEFADNRWTPDNPSEEHPRTWNRDDEYWASQPNTYFLRETDYVRLKNLEIGYSLSEQLSGVLGVQRMRVYASGFNLLTWDKLNIMDPEVRDSDGQYYPQKRVVNVGLSLTF